MTGHELKRSRRERGLSQERAAKALAVSQPYLSLLERGDRPMTRTLTDKAVRWLGLRPTELPSSVSAFKVAKTSDDQLTADLAALGYKGFSHWKPSRRKNPADVLMSALNANDRDARLMEALPWLVLAFPDMNWNDVARVAKMHDLQNRLGFVISVARGLAEQRQDTAMAAQLKLREAELEPSMLAREGTLCHDSMTNAERRWLSDRRPANARHWRLLADLVPEHLNHHD